MKKDHKALTSEPFTMAAETKSGTLLAHHEQVLYQNPCTD